MAARLLAPLLLAASATADVFLNPPGDGIIRQFQSAAARFGPALPPEGLAATICETSKPVDGCTPLHANMTECVPGDGVYVVLLRRSDCPFEDKVKAAQAANFSGVIVYDEEPRGELIFMSGVGAGVHIPSVFVGYDTGMQLLAAERGSTVNITPDAFPQWPQYFTTMAAAAACGVLVFAVFVVYRRQQVHRILSREGRAPRGRMTRRQALQLPTRGFEPCDEGEHCCICLEPYGDGDVITVLPCNHVFHKGCIEPWLTGRERTCPICKRDPLASDTTPLLAASRNSSSDEAPLLAGEEEPGPGPGPGPDSVVLEAGAAPAAPASA